MATHILSRVPKIISNPHFWIVLVLLAIGIVIHYPQQILSISSDSLFSFLGLTRHTMERVLSLSPAIYAGLFFGLKAGLTSLAGSLLIILPRAIFISSSPLDALLESVGIILIGGLANLWLEQNRKKSERHQQLLLRLETAQEEERRRIARELHDGTTQDLVTLLHQMEKFTSISDSLSPQDAALLEGLWQQTSKTLDEVLRFIQGLRPPILDDLGFLPALEWLTSDLTKQSGIAVDMAVHGPVRRFPHEIELVLFRITQEALRNMWKHSKASRAWVTVEFSNAKTILTVKDNGKGFELTKSIDYLLLTGKLGLIGIQERAQRIGGKLILQSKPGKGTIIIVEVPI